MTDMDVALAAISDSKDLPAWLIMAVSIFAVIYLTFRKKKRGDPLASQPFRSSLNQQKALERDMQNVIVELSEMSRQMTAQLETRATKLDLLIQEADQKIAKLNEALAAVAAGQTPDLEAIDRPVKPAAPKNGAMKPSQPTMRIASESIDTEDRWNEIYSLADRGLSTSQIAAKLSRPEGEIDLILHLRPKQLEPVDVEVSEPPSIVSAG